MFWAFDNQEIKYNEDYNGGHSRLACKYGKVHINKEIYNVIPYAWDPTAGRKHHQRFNTAPSRSVPSENDEKTISSIEQTTFLRVFYTVAKKIKSLDIMYIDIQ